MRICGRLQDGDGLFCGRLQDDAFKMLLLFPWVVEGVLKC